MLSLYWESEWCAEQIWAKAGTRVYFTCVGFIPWGRDPALAWPSPVKLGLLSIVSPCQTAFLPTSI